MAIRKVGLLQMAQKKCSLGQWDVMRTQKENRESTKFGSPQMTQKLGKTVLLILSRESRRAKGTCDHSNSQQVVYDLMQSTI